MEEIKVLNAVLWDREPSRSLEKKWVPTYPTVVAYFSPIARPVPIFRKLVAIISSVQNHPHFIILNQKINSNNKLPMLLTQIVL